MKMLAADTTAFPKLAYYVRNDLPRVIEVPAIVATMRKVGQINKGRLRSALTWGAGARIRITTLVGAFGEFSPGIGSEEIRINMTMVTDFESGKGKRIARAGDVFLVGVTLLHELIHWGDDKDGIDRSGEEGEEFEQLIYGSVIN